MTTKQNPNNLKFLEIIYLLKRSREASERVSWLIQICLLYFVKRAKGLDIKSIPACDLVYIQMHPCHWIK